MDEKAYGRLEAERHEDKSFIDTIKRLTDAVNNDWRCGFGTYADDGDELVEYVRRSRTQLSSGLTVRQRRASNADPSDDSQ
ncbi:hypothetical protein BRC81_05175 [Halobacteriales archaeon QS_1_68_20]|nr:MAG: hypothetical protein BRC81_05175 [Halobacteriales archaeon QS_1_68_20]